MNEENKTSKASLIRVIISTVALIIIILGMVDVIPNKISLITSVALVCIAVIWSGVEAIRNKRTKSAIVNFVMAAILVALTLTAILL